MESRKVYRGGIKTSRRILFRILGGILALFYLFLPMEGEGSDLFPKVNIQPIKDKRRAPNLYLPGLDGKKVDLKNLKGKVVFLNFWATWCGPCKEEMPSMEALHQEFKEKGFVFLTVCVDYGGVNPARELIEKHRYTFPVLIDQKCETLDSFEIKGIPMTFIIDRKGRMRGRASGPRNWKSPEIVMLVNQLIAEKER